MDEKLRYYEEELNYLVESGREFARLHPDRAEHLALADPRYRDPHVERLIESFAFLTGRVRQRLDDDFPELTHALLGLVWPHYLQPIPSIALLAFMIPLFGIGVLPALVALWTYSLFPILRNTYTGLREAAPEAVSAGISLGMTEAQALFQVRLPLAAPVIMAGIRTAAVLTVGTATLAAFIGAGGLGEPILTGMQLADTRLILFGALPAAALALAVDLVLGRVADRLQPYSGNQTS